ncbi:helix-turn-helix transcriptional regulator [Kibdelosporangium philippinense]|uniref:Helix-turn-helix transcriptional regulator n=1 Tax=Kibdelosporangium philippinense TaxID=211113 RepID=A0ABS8Z5A9_9PSEU|nr:helix-turn-helix domain-containing protein [Kibdelosporangium philippinense]MCE7003094.1 helix-turn-helix transcriptional regulator [Kibdelosporangium philippinense]
MNDIHRVCVRFHSAIEMIGTRWTGAILRAIFTGHHRYAEIKAAIPGLSDTMLAARLRSLESDGLVVREVSEGPPVQVQYKLSEKALDLAPVLDSVVEWAHKWIPLPDDAKRS